MPTRARQTQAEEGFILIEVLVSALILAIVAGAVLALITATTHSAASERAHSVAYGLAQEDQARLRTMRLSSLNEKNELRPPVEVGGTTYEVRSQGRFVNNSSGTRSCSSGEASADYVEITSTVSSPTLLNPVALHSIISPTSGSLDPSHGSLAIQATNGAGNPVSGVVASITGPTNATASTEEKGCVLFADIPAGVYKLTTSANGLVNRQGETTEVQPTLSVPAAGTAQVPVYFDRPGQIRPKFGYEEPGQTELQSAAIDSMMVYNSESGKPAAMYGTPGTYSPLPSLEVKNVYPFAATFSVYAGSCVEDQPKAPSAAIPSFAVVPGGTAEPLVQVPSLVAPVTFEGRSVGPGAKVTLTDTKCPQTGTKVLRTFTTNANGHAAVSTTAKAEAIGVPWSTYKVCASATVTNSSRKTEYRKLELPSVAIETIAAPVTLALNLSSSGAIGKTESTYHC